VSYVGQDESVEAGRPIELYLFRNNTIITQQFAYTTAPREQVHNNVTYVPRALTRTDVAVDQAEPGSDRDVKITLPESDPLVNPRWINTIPPGKDEITIFRRHASDSLNPPETITYWKGFIDSVSFVGGGQATIRAVSEAGLLRRMIPKRTYRGLCGHVLFDGGCKVIRSNFEFDITVTAISTDGQLVTFNSAETISGQAADYFVGGELQKPSGDRRMVLAYTDLGGNSGRATILLPFFDVKIGDRMKLTAGCDHSITTCRLKFSNEINFGGFPWVPTRNPFDTGILQ
jgi:uncharacterized phage protein (TIGR02218 family)